jgi:hypothetical protein
MELLTTLKNLPEVGDTSVASFLADVHRNGAHELIRTALKTYSEGKVELAWSYVVKAAEKIGHQSGLNDAAENETAANGVVQLLRENGRKGGKAKGANAERKRDAAATALIAAAPNGKWPSKMAFELKYHAIVKMIPGFRDTEHNRRKIVHRPDIKATLPSAIKAK